MSGFVCPVPLRATETVLLGHGSGGKLSSELLHSIFLPAFDNPLLERLEESSRPGIWRRKARLHHGFIRG